MADKDTMKLRLLFDLICLEPNKDSIDALLFLGLDFVFFVDLNPSFTCANFGVSDILFSLRIAYLCYVYDLLLVYYSRV